MKKRHRWIGGGQRDEPAIQRGIEEPRALFDAEARGDVTPDYSWIDELDDGVELSKDADDAVILPLPKAPK
jgi:hypothetical protein